jgi:predicted transposase/invertase (TIGR01784 family)
VCTLELPKLKESDTGALSDWMRFLTVRGVEELDVLATKDAGIRKAVEMLKYLSEEETLRSLEMSHEKYLYDVAATRKEALAEGIATGEARGHREGTLRVARAALLKGLDISTIRDITGLDGDAIRRLQEN